MMIDDDTLKQLLRINDELLQLCKWLERTAWHGNFVSPHTASGPPHPDSSGGGRERTTLNGSTSTKTAYSNPSRSRTQGSYG